MRYFIDTEFIERPGTLQLISIGIVKGVPYTTKDPAQEFEYYAVSSAFDKRLANPWVRQNVLPHLGDSPRKTHDVIRREIRAFVGDDPSPEFWGYFADYDWVLFCWLFGAMIDLPIGWPQYCLDIKQEMRRLGIKRDDLPKQTGTAHNALDDACWTADVYDFVAALEERERLERIKSRLRRPEYG